MDSIREEEGEREVVMVDRPTVFGLDALAAETGNGLTIYNRLQKVSVHTSLAIPLHLTIYCSLQLQKARAELDRGSHEVIRNSDQITCDEPQIPAVVSTLPVRSKQPDPFLQETNHGQFLQ